MTTTSDVEAGDFRRVLGRVPTGVCLITARGEDGQCHAMVVGTFTSVSLDPPLVAFLPAKSSSTFPKISDTGHFCVNVLSAEQGAVCQAFFSKATDRFERWQWTDGATGSPLLAGAIARIECEIADIHDAGDHYIVIGRVINLEAGDDTNPLIFFSGGYGRFSGHTLAAWQDTAAIEKLRYVDIAHGRMQQLSRSWGVETLALIREATDMVVIASTGSEQATRLPTRVGLRLPIVPPMGALLVGWDDPSWVDWWLTTEAPAAVSPDERAAKLALVRTRGYSLVLASDDEFDLLVQRQSRDLTRDAELLRPEILDALDHSRWEPRIEDITEPVAVRTLSAPTFTPSGDLAFMLTVFGMGVMVPEEVVALKDEVVAAAAGVTAQIRTLLEVEA